MSSDRTLDDAMGMTPAEIAELRAKVDRLARRREDTNRKEATD